MEEAAVPLSAVVGWNIQGFKDYLLEYDAWNSGLAKLIASYGRERRISIG
jgi:hypothetical protein